MEDMTDMPTEQHIRPKYYGYTGGYARVGRCQHCGIVSLYEDFHPVNPCWKCGAKDKVWFSAKWVSTSHWWQFPKRGFWLAAERAQLV